jgi:hypothetical protein
MTTETQTQEQENRIVNIDGVDHNFDDLSEVAQDAIVQLANIQQKQNNLQADYNQLEMARKGYLTSLNEATVEDEAGDTAAEAIVA